MRVSAPRRTLVSVPSMWRSWRATTRVSPRSLPVCRPAPDVRATSPPGPHVHSPIDSGVSLARNSTVSFSTSSTLRTCKDGGVTGVPSTTSLRAPSASATVTSAPAAVWAGTPGTMSTQTASVRSWSTAVAPVAGSTRSVRRAVWSRGWTTTNSPWSSQMTSARYSSDQRIGVRAPSSVMISALTCAFGVPAAG